MCEIYLFVHAWYQLSDRAGLYQTLVQISEVVGEQNVQLEQQLVAIEEAKKNGGLLQDTE